ncbi:GNAT family N-acetyltransferase [Methylocapsa sp. S129]|uniref:GNAT family N-acetyltransferase n=1 Tax=Methylocapsa sp. S129 TaxID=1641869 RepID=UPI00131D4612|nr:N-acetyltransferase [Methylocapsa sp. S129]
MMIRQEREEDFAAIGRIVAEAFEHLSYSNQREQFLVDALRSAGALTVALVADDDGEIVGHIAFSPVWIDGRFQDWYGLGPVAVRPDRQGAGVGQALVRAGLARLVNLHAGGCIVLGAPAYYSRFGFAAHPRLRFAGAPPEHFMALKFGNAFPSGIVTYHSAFSQVT